MPVEIELPDGTKARTDHLPAGVIADVARKADTNWAHIVHAPHIGDGFAMIHLYDAACDHAGQTPKVGLTAPELAELFEPVDDDLPDEYSDGIPDVDPPEPASPEQGSPATT